MYLTRFWLPDLENSQRWREGSIAKYCIKIFGGSYLEGYDLASLRLSSWFIYDSPMPSTTKSIIFKNSDRICKRSYLEGL